MIVPFVFSSNNKNCGDCGDLSIRRHESMNWYSPVLGFLLKIRKVESANLVLFRSERGWSMFFSISIHCSAHHQYSLVDFTVHHFIIVLRMNLWSIYYKAANASIRVKGFNIQTTTRLSEPVASVAWQFAALGKGKPLRWRKPGRLCQQFWSIAGPSCNRCPFPTARTFWQPGKSNTI